MYQVLLEYDYGDWQSGWVQEIMCDVRELETDEYSLNLLCIVSLNISIS